MNDFLSENGKSALVEMLVIFEKLPIEKQYYLLGYARSEADRTLQGEVHG